MICVYQRLFFKEKTIKITILSKNGTEDVYKYYCKNSACRKRNKPGSNNIFYNFKINRADTTGKSHSNHCTDKCVCC